MNFTKLKAELDKNVLLYETPEFIPNDPISLPHRFSRLQDIEIVALFASTIAWGNRKSILKSGELLLSIFSNAPYDFIVNANEKEFAEIKRFYHRTFNGEDAFAFASALRRIYQKEKIESLETLFAKKEKNENLVDRLDNFRSEFCKDMKQASKKHLGNMKKGSAAKRLNLFLRWLVRPNTRGVDFGLWKSISPSELFLPLDVHSARVSESLGLLKRKSRDAKAVIEVTERLKKFCPEDPAKYDFALFAVDV
ncbi:MAG: TIGR02757 family protein [Treponemataceae bacterium]